MSLAQFVYYPVFGLPLTVYVGVLALVIFLTAATIATLIRFFNANIPLHWHYRLAYTALTIAVIHGTVMLLVYLVK